jgi:hypothetical protein
LYKEKQGKMDRISLLLVRVRSPLGSKSNSAGIWNTVWLALKSHMSSKPGALELDMWERFPDRL